jgi:signal transduction histidine kinase
MAAPSSLLIATLPPTSAHRRAALAVALGLLAFFLCVLPFSGVRLARSDVVIPTVSMAMFVGDCLSAGLLFGQFAVQRSRALLVLAAGYLFTGLLVVPYALTFPGAFSPTGLLGAGLQTAGWIFVVWHIGLPAAVIAYALLDRGSDTALVRAPVPKSIALASLIAAALAALVTYAAIAFHGLLPALTLDPVRMTGGSVVRIAMVGVCAVAVAILARRRSSVLDLWLLVVAFAWLLDSMLTYVTESRYTVAWYANRVIRVVSANVVLFVLLAESARLYARLALSAMAEQREREGRMMSMEAMSAALEHEMRQPLAAIMANGNAARRWLERSPPDLSEAREALVDVSADAARTAQILQSVRQLFANRELAHEPVDINALIRETVALAKVSLDASAIGVQLQLAERTPLVSASRPQMQEVLLNLVNNAAEAMRGVTDHPTLLKITTAPAAPGRVEIAVADTGPGIEPSQLERIFEAFFTTKANGMGMGLAICRSIVERHGGTRSAARGEPYGAIFRIELPATA